MPLEKTAANDTEAPGGESAPEPVKLSSLTELLAEPAAPADGEKPEGNDQGEAAGNGAENAKPKMFNDLAESLGIELDDLYKLKVSTADGETVSIEELKALQVTQDEFVLRELEFEESRASKEGNMLQAQNELSQIVAALPEGSLSPAILEKLRTKNTAHVEAEQARTLGAIPTWKDEATRTKDMVGMTAHLERFGFPANHLASVVDHRMLVFIRESHLREARIKNALERVKAGAPNPTTPTGGKPAGKTAVAPKNANARNGLEQFFSTL